MRVRTSRAKLDGATPLRPDEAKLLESVALARPRGFLRRFAHGMSEAFGVVTRDEFDRVCLSVARDLDGQALTPDQAAEKARRLVEAHTRAAAGVICPRCDVSDQAVLVIWLGTPHSGFLFQRAIKLPDPKGARRG